MSEIVKQNVAGVRELRYIIVKNDVNRAIAAFKNLGDAETLLANLDDPEFIIVELLDQLGYIQR